MWCPLHPACLPKLLETQPKGEPERLLPLHSAKTPGAPSGCRALGTWPAPPSRIISAPWPSFQCAWASSGLRAFAWAGDPHPSPCFPSYSCPRQPGFPQTVPQSRARQGVCGHGLCTLLPAVPPPALPPGLQGGPDIPLGVTPGPQLLPQSLSLSCVACLRPDSHEHPHLLFMPSCQRRVCSRVTQPIRRALVGAGSARGCRVVRGSGACSLPRHPARSWR